MQIMISIMTSTSDVKEKSLRITGDVFQVGIEQQSMSMGQLKYEYRFEEARLPSPRIFPAQSGMSSFSFHPKMAGVEGHPRIVVSGTKSAEVYPPCDFPMPTGEN